MQRSLFYENANGDQAARNERCCASSVRIVVSTKCFSESQKPHKSQTKRRNYRYLSTKTLTKYQRKWSFWSWHWSRRLVRKISEENLVVRFRNYQNLEGSNQNRKVDCTNHKKPVPWKHGRKSL
jgi:hypothetical protein